MFHVPLSIWAVGDFLSVRSFEVLYLGSASSHVTCACHMSPSAFEARFPTVGKREFRSNQEKPFEGVGAKFRYHNTAASVKRRQDFNTTCDGSSCFIHLMEFTV